MEVFLQEVSIGMVDVEDVAMTVAVMDGWHSLLGTLLAC